KSAGRRHFREWLAWLRVKKPNGVGLTPAPLPHAAFVAQAFSSARLDRLECAAGQQLAFLVVRPELRRPLGGMLPMGRATRQKKYQRKKNIATQHSYPFSMSAFDSMFLLHKGYHLVRRWQDFS
ncbi:MAG: hypothetical protein KAT93_04205, partial [Desulfuromonadales bacterium]|nr:hypothetical protein [Desulfuromonadales bacterium]